MPAFARSSFFRYSGAMSSLRALLMMVAAGLSLAGSPIHAEEQYDANDPFERVNRVTHGLNEGLDKYLLAPVARGWEWISPEFVRTALVNFDDNLRFPINTTNNVLQWKWRAAGEECARFAINTTVGILGFRDVASGWGLEKQNEDTGQTFGVWGIPPGPYLVLPLFGPSNPRDAVGLAADSILSLYWIVAPFWVSLGYSTGEVINRRAVYAEDIDNARRAALDYYVFIRNAYSQRRQALIRDATTTETDYELLSDEDDLYEVDEDLYEVEDDASE